MVDGLRVEAGFASGSTVSPFYDAMLAKLIVAAPTRDDAARRLVSVLRRARLHGLQDQPRPADRRPDRRRFLTGDVSTAMLADGSVAPERRVDDAGLVASAAALAGWSRSGDARVQQRIPAGFRNVVSQPQRIRVHRRHRREWYGGERPAPASTARPSSPRPRPGRARCRRRTPPLRGAISGNRIDVDGPDGHVALERKPRFVDPSTQVAAGSLLAPMPGSVIAVHAQVGDVVAEGAPILVMEAMKMQHTIAAPYSGTVTELAATTGQQVEAGTVLAVVTPDADAETEGTD